VDADCGADAAGREHGGHGHPGDEAAPHFVSGLAAPQDRVEKRRSRVMAKYVDGFLLPLPKKNVEAYRRMSQKAGKVWRELGALDYVECIGDDLDVKMGASFRKQARARPGETVVFSWIAYKSKAHRDRVNAKVMKDPRIASMMNDKSMPFDVKRMAYGGFKVIVDL
jgi:uncharacterized protein YbaA (DUF1428 family)